TIIDASALGDRVFQLFSNTNVTFQNLVITGGHAHENGTTGGTTARGGGILDNGGNLNLTNVLIDGNTAVGDDGPPGASGQDAQGGGLYISGGSSVSVKIAGSSIINNTAVGGGGGTVGGSGGSGQGGGIYASGGTLMLSNSSLTSNTAAGSIGGSPGFPGN